MAAPDINRPRLRRFYQDDDLNTVIFVWTGVDQNQPEVEFECEMVHGNIGLIMVPMDRRDYTPLPDESVAPVPEAKSAKTLGDESQKRELEAQRLEREGREKEQRDRRARASAK